jgi:outer membrane lipoprotein-sorting protein
MSYLYFIVIALLFVSLSVGLSPVKAEATAHLHDLQAHVDEAMELLTKAKDSYDNLQDYIAEIHKQVHKHGELEKDELTVIKFQKPFKLYLKWLTGKNEGAELLYVEGENDNKMLVHKKILFGTRTLKLDPDGFWVRKFSRHSIKDAGFGGIINRSYAQFAEAKKNNEVLTVSCSMEEVNGRLTHKVAFAVSPHGRHNGYYCRSAIEYFDAENFLPVKVIFWLWEDDEAESFTFNNVKLNVGLNGEDFDKDNKDYNF